MSQECQKSFFNSSITNISTTPFKFEACSKGLHGGSVVSIVTSKQGLAFKSCGWQPSLCLCGFPLGSLGFIPQAKDMQVRLTGYSKLPTGVNVSVNVSPLCDPEREMV